MLIFCDKYRRLHRNSFENTIRRSRQVDSVPLESHGLYLGGLIRDRPQDGRREVKTLLEVGGIMKVSKYNGSALPAFESDLKSALLGAPWVWRLFGVFG